MFGVDGGGDFRWLSALWGSVAVPMDTLATAKPRSPLYRLQEGRSHRRRRRSVGQTRLDPDSIVVEVWAAFKRQVSSKTICTVWMTCSPCPLGSREWRVDDGYTT